MLFPFFRLCFRLNIDLTTDKDESLVCQGPYQAASNAPPAWRDTAALLLVVFVVMAFVAIPLFLSLNALYMSVKFPCSVRLDVTSPDLNSFQPLPVVCCVLCDHEGDWVRGKKMRCDHVPP